MFKNYNYVVFVLALFMLNSCTSDNIDEYNTEELVINSTYSTNNDDCGECDGRLKNISFKYTGNSAKYLVIKGSYNSGTYFCGYVYPNETFTLNPIGSNSILHRTLKFYQNGCYIGALKTDCTMPVEVGTTYGNYQVVGGESTNNGLLCSPEEEEVVEEGCTSCNEKATSLTLKYEGLVAGIVKVTQGQGEIAYNSFVFPGSRFTIVGEDSEGTLSDQISISINGLLNTTINTNCDNPIGPGLVSGLFMVVNGESKDGGELCPVADMPGDDNSDDTEEIIID